MVMAIDAIDLEKKEAREKFNTRRKIAAAIQAKCCDLTSSCEDQLTVLSGTASTIEHLTYSL